VKLDGGRLVLVSDVRGCRNLVSVQRQRQVQLGGGTWGLRLGSLDVPIRVQRIGSSRCRLSIIARTNPLQSPPPERTSFQDLSREGDEPLDPDLVTPASNFQQKAVDFERSAGLDEPPKDQPDERPEEPDGPPCMLTEEEKPQEDAFLEATSR